MSPTKILKISLAFVGLLVGAGFATGQEVVQYFIAFGVHGVWGAVLAGVLMTLTGAVILQLGSYYLADEHRMVFRNVSHPVISTFLDVSVTITLFAIGFVMLAGAGSTLDQQYGIPSWIGAGVMTLLVMAAGMLDVDKVSSVISGLTPFAILAVVGAFIYTMFHLPGDTSALEAAAAQASASVQPWWLSAINYTGLSLLLAVSMCLVIGGNYPNPKEAGWGGLGGGALYTTLLILAAVTLYLNIDKVVDSDIPMLKLVEGIGPVFAHIMVFIIFAMVFNTSIGMFYALGRRLTAKHRDKYRPVFLGTCVLGYAVSFIGFQTLMKYVYPAIGYVGMFMMVVMAYAWFKRREPITDEADRRSEMQDLVAAREDSSEDFDHDDQKKLEKHASDSNVEDEKIIDAIESEEGAVSAGECLACLSEQSIQDFGGGVEVEGLSGSAVEEVGDVVEVGL